MTYKGWTKLDLHVFQFFACLLSICLVFFKIYFVLSHKNVFIVFSLILSCCITQS